MNLYTERVKPKMLFRIGRVTAIRPRLFVRERVLMFVLCIFMDVTVTVILQHCVVESLHRGRDCRMSRMSNIEPMTFRFHIELAQHLSTLSGKTQMCTQVRLAGHRPSQDSLSWLMPHPHRSAANAVSHNPRCPASYDTVLSGVARL
jgi:hypothetical protein